jgi:hypothetical protein
MTSHLPKAALVALLCAIPAAHGQQQSSGDPNLAHPTQVVTVPGKGYTLSGLVTHRKDAKRLRYGLAMFPGAPGILKLREEGGEARFELKGNFLVRSRRHWLDEETLVVLVDAPSDQWGSFEHGFREQPRYGADVAALLKEVGQRHGVEDWTFIGTSEGSVSAFHAARMNPALARRVVLTSSLFLASRSGPGLSAVSWQELSSRILWVHHEDDPCSYTPYRDAVRFAEKSRSPLLTVRGGGPARGEPCQAFSAHGFVGVEVETINAIRSWLKTGVVPPTVTK